MNKENKMKRVVIADNPSDVINLKGTGECRAIFAMKDGMIQGMVVKYPGGTCWAISVGGDLTANGWWDIRERLISAGISQGYEFYIDVPWDR